jgi:hypothetical protein
VVGSPCPKSLVLCIPLFLKERKREAKGCMIIIWPGRQENTKGVCVAIDSPSFTSHHKPINYIFIYKCVCVCVCVREKGKEKGVFSSFGFFQEMKPFM